MGVEGEAANQEDVEADAGDRLDDLIETKAERIVEAVLQESIGKLIDQGRLDAVMQRVLDRRLARASVPPEHEDHELVDEVSGIIRD